MEDTKLSDKEKKWTEEVITSNKEGLDRLAREEPAKDLRQRKVLRALKKAFRRLVKREEKVSTINL